MRPTRLLLTLGLLLAAGAIFFFYLKPRMAGADGAASAPQKDDAHRQAGANGADHRGGAGGARGAGGPVPVVASTVERKDVPIYLDAIGTVQAFNSVTVRTRVDGQLEKVAFTEGQDVKKGDLLALIDARPFQAAYDGAVAKKAQDEAQLASARSILQRDTELLSRKVLDQQTYDTQKFTVDGLDALVKTDQAAVESAQTQLSYCTITAPLEGRVGVRQVDEGNVVHAADANGLVVIAQLHPISVVFNLPQQQLPQVNAELGKEPLKVIALDRDQKKPLGEGTLAVVDNGIDPTTGTVKLKATFANENLSLWPGQFVNTRLLVTTRRGGLVVPAPVIQRGPQGSFAYVIKPDGTVEMRPVAVALIEDNQALVDSGLQLGEKVVVDGQYRLQPGAPVEVTNGTERGLSKGGEGDASPGRRRHAGAGGPPGAGSAAAGG